MTTHEPLIVVCFVVDDGTHIKPVGEWVVTPTGRRIHSVLAHSGSAERVSPLASIGRQYAIIFPDYTITCVECDGRKLWNDFLISALRFPDVWSEGSAPVFTVSMCRKHS